MKKILVIAPQNPYPANDGGKISIYYPLIHLAAWFQIHFVFPYFEPLPIDLEKHFAEFGIKIYPQRFSTRDTISGVISNFFSSVPYKFKKYHKQPVLNNIKEIVQKENIEIIWCNHSHVAWYALQLQKELNVKIFLREHNIEYSLVQQVMNLKKSGLLRTFIQMQYMKTKRYEIRCWKNFEQTFFISDSDFSVAKTNCSDCTKLHLLYDSFLQKKEIQAARKEPHSFIFTGNINTFQNYYNLQKFIKEIWEPLVKTDSRWKLYITGNKDDIIRKKIKTDFAANNIINLGFVDDIDQTICTKKYFISPTYIGSGLRIKVLNAMAAGAVCFLTPLDAEMLSFLEDFNNIIKYNDFNDFHINLMRLESSDSLYNSISLQALRAGTAFSWKDYAVKVYNEITRV